MAFRRFLWSSLEKIPRVSFFYRDSHHSSFSYRTHTCGELRDSHVGSHVTLCGWMQKPRVIASMGMVFIPLTDATGTTQLICEDEDIHNIINGLKTESVIEIEGMVSRRHQRNVNKSMDTGSIEVQIVSMKVLNKTEDLPFLPYSRATDISEELRLKERHLDIRRPNLQQILRLRSQISNTVRQFLITHGFVEVETPTLFKPTPEGAKEFLVPSKERGRFYSLAQSPQQFKQLLMVGGIDRYFQFARCYRDEDSRSDRQPEFTQIDLEMSFVSEEGVKNMTEELMVDVFKHTLPHMTPPTIPFPCIPYRQAMDKYGTDKPDTRFKMEIHCLSDEWREAVRQAVRDTELSHLMNLDLIGFYVPQWKSMVNQFDPGTWKHLMSPVRDSTTQYSTILSCFNNNVEILSSADERFDGSILAHSCRQKLELMSKVLSNAVSSFRGGDTVEGGFVLAAYGQEENKDHALLALGRLRTSIASELSNNRLLNIPSDVYELLWVTDFPLFSIVDDSETGPVIKSTHHPFTIPKQQDIEKLYTASSHDELTQITAQNYDLVVNGWELGGGSIRIHDANIQEHVMSNILKTRTDRFSHLLKGLRSGCPPHGGIALGLDRLVAILCGASSLRDVIAFPKSTTGRDLLTGAPASLSSDELSDYGIDLLKDRQKF